MNYVVPSQVVDLIDQTFPAAKKQPDTQEKRFSVDRSHAATLAAIVDLAEQIPSNLLPLSKKKYTIFISSISAFKIALDAWKLRNYGLDRIPGLGNKNPISLLREVLSECPDEFLPSEDNELDFIDDEELRANLKNDIGSINKALSNGEWKATTVLAGSIIEALLFWKLNQYENAIINDTVQALLEVGILSRTPGSNLESWTLHPFIEVALKLGNLKKDTVIQAKLAKDFRNLIHPGREKRLQQSCNRGTALSAVAAIEFVINDLNNLIAQPSAALDRRSRAALD